MTAAVAVVHSVINQTMPAGFAEPADLYRLFPTTITGTDRLADEFQRLADSWRRDTQFCSSVSDMVLDPSYQQIIGKGSPVVPFILREMEKGPDHWYWALGVITQETPAENAPEGDIAAICQAWLDWGMRRGLVR
jgi:hypothetical protein